MKKGGGGSVPAKAQYYSQRVHDEYYDRDSYARDYYRDGRTYCGRECKRSSGTTGLLAGGVSGALIGSAIGSNTPGMVLSALGGGLLGRSLNKQHDAEQNYRNSC